MERGGFGKVTEFPISIHQALPLRFGRCKVKDVERDLFRIWMTIGGTVENAVDLLLGHIVVVEFTYPRKVWEG
jgi:hypothetical protein